MKTDPPELYNKYVGHDDNRDWYAFTQVETQLTVDKIHNVWHPQIVNDIHQQGENGSRLFLPPYIAQFLHAGAPAWEALERLAKIHPRFAHGVFREACGLPASPSGRRLQGWLEANGKDAASVLDQAITLYPRLESFLQQDMHERATLLQSQSLLGRLVNG